MIQALWSASSGMHAQQLSLDNVANNMANVNTTGFKKSRVEFQDLLYSQIREPGMVTRTGQTVANGIQVGNGSRPSATQMIFQQGSYQETGNPMDVAISGDAFFEVLLPDGSKAYTRDGSFKIDADGYLVNGSGYLPNMESSEGGLLTFPIEGSGLEVDSQGVIYRDKQLVQLESYTFTSTKDLQEVEPGVFKPTDESGEAVLVSEIESQDAEEQFDEEGTPRVFYQILLPDGETAYTTEYTFKIDNDGRLSTAGKGYPLDPEVYVDLQEAEDTLGEGAIVTADGTGVVNAPVEAARLTLVQFVNPAGLDKAGSNLYLQTANSGAPQAAGNYKLLTGTLEMSNVQVAEEMVNMMVAQRAYEINSRSVKTSDEMLGLANSLLRR